MCPPLLRPLSPLNVERMQDLGLYQYSTSVMDPGISKLGDMVPVEFLAFEICFHGALHICFPVRVYRIKFIL